MALTGKKACKRINKRFRKSGQITITPSELVAGGLCREGVNQALPNCDSPVSVRALIKSVEVHYVIAWLRGSLCYSKKRGVVREVARETVKLSAGIKMRDSSELTSKLFYLAPSSSDLRRAIKNVERRHGA